MFNTFFGNFYIYIMSNHYIYMSNYYKYQKYKTKYIQLKRYILSNNQTGGAKINIVILHMPTIYNEPNISEDMIPIIKKLSKIGKVYNYFFKFSYYGNRFTLKDLEFENTAKDMYIKFKHLNKFLVVAVGHAAPYGLYFVDQYPEKCTGIICYPFRFYCKESYERRIWKVKDNKGFEMMIKNKKYNVDDHLLNINEKRFKKLFINPQYDEKVLIWSIFDFNLQKQYYKIPSIFKVPTYLYTRLDLNVEDIIKLNYERKEIAKMKQIITEDDALYNSMIWNFDRIKYDYELKRANESNNFLKIKYLVSIHDS